MKSNATYVYMKGSVSMGPGQCSNEVAACFDAKTGAEVEETKCTGENLSTFELTSLTPALAQAAAADAKKIVAKKITGHIDFTADAAVPEE